MLTILAFILVFVLPIIILVLIPLSFMRACEKKHQLKVLILSVCLFGLYYCLIAYSVVVRDADGHFFGFEYDNGAVFYDTQHERYIWNTFSEWDDPVLIKEEDNSIRLNPYALYVNQDGEIVKEDPQTLLPTRNKAVMLTEDGEKRYSFIQCYRDMFGRLRYPESRGFKLGEVIISPVTYEIEMEFYELTGIQDVILQEFAFAELAVIMIIILIFLYGKIKKNKKMFSFSIKAFIVCLPLTFANTLGWMIVKSFWSMAVLLLIPAAIGYFAAPLIDGAARFISEWELSREKLDEGEKWVSDCIALSTKKGVRSVRLMILGYNILFTANWLLVIIAVCFNW